MLSPVVSHVTCALDHQRRILEARTASLAPRRRRRRRGERTAPSADLAVGLGARGEDVWGALRL